MKYIVTKLSKHVTKKASTQVGRATKRTNFSDINPRNAPDHKSTKNLQISNTRKRGAETIDKSDVKASTVLTKSKQGFQR